MKPYAEFVKTILTLSLAGAMAVLPVTFSARADVTMFPDVGEAMTNPDFWAYLDPEADRVQMDQASIAALNERMLHTPDCQTRPQPASAPRLQPKAAGLWKHILLYIHYKKCLQ